MKVLLIHNALTEYRLACFRIMAMKHDIQFLIVSKSVASKIYNLKFDIGSELKVTYLEDIGGWKKLPSYIREGGYDAIVVPPADTFRDLWVDYVSLSAVKKRTRVIYWTEKWEAEIDKQPIMKRLKNWLHSKAIGSVARRADCCLAASICSKRYYMNRLCIPENKIIILPHSNVSPVCEEKIDIRAKYMMPKDAQIILFLGRLVPRKGCDLLIKAFSQIVKKNCKIYLLIAGEGECYDSLKLLASKENIPNVIFAGKIEPARRALYYQQSTVSCLPSFSFQGVIEAYGLTVNESLEQGTPVVTTTAVGAGHELHDNNTVIMVEENNIEALKDGLEKFLNVEEKIKLSKMCKEKYKEFSVERMAENFCKAFEM